MGPVQPKGDRELRGFCEVVAQYANKMRWMKTIQLNLKQEENQHLVKMDTQKNHNTKHQLKTNSKQKI